MHVTNKEENNMSKLIKNKYRRKWTGFLVLLITLSMITVSCGGGLEFAGGGISGTGISIGAILGFGSIRLNDSTFELTNETSVTVNDISGLSQDDLSVGMVAVVSFDGQNALEIEVDNELKGLVNSVDAGNNTLTVMGNAVIVDNATVFDNVAGLAGLTAGVDNVEVHGLFNFNDNTIRATRIELLAAAPGTGEFEVKGAISSFDNPPGTFKIGTLTVDFAANGLTLPAGTGNGSFIEVKGDLVGGTLEAVSVELEDEIPGLDPDDDFEIEGIISFVDNPGSPGLVRINDQEIIINSSTEFRNGDAASLAVGTKIEAEGNVNGTGQFIADKIELEDSISIDAQVSKSGSTLTVFGGITILTNNFTVIEDEKGQPITADDIQDGDYLEIEGFRGAGNDVVALEIEIDSNNRSILEGPVDAINEPDLTILGVNIITNAGTDFEVDDVENVSANFFFSQVKVGSIVKAREDSIVTSAQIIGDEVELQNDDD